MMDTFFTKLNAMTAEDAQCYLKQFSVEFVEQGFFDILEYKNQIPIAYQALENDVNRRKGEILEKAESEQLSTLDSENVVDEESKNV